MITTIEFKYGFIYKEVRYAWKDKKLYRFLFERNTDISNKKLKLQDSLKINNHGKRIYTIRDCISYKRIRV